MIIKFIFIKMMIELIKLHLLSHYSYLFLKYSSKTSLKMKLNIKYHTKKKS